MNTVEAKISNPLNFYKKPSEVGQDKELTISEKITLLTNWLDDIAQRQIAESENMPGNDDMNYYTAEVEKLLHKYQIEALGRD